jgi:hypothetical protein
MQVSRRATIAVVAASITAGTIAGCSGSSNHKASAPASSAHPSVSTSVSSAPGLPPGVVNATSLPVSPPNSPALRSNVSVSSCAATTGGWGASGTATNPGTASADYTITVFFTTVNATVIGSAQTHVTVKAGGKESWSASATFTAPAKTLCVLRGVG